MGVDEESADRIIEAIERAAEQYFAPIDQHVDPVTLKLSDGTPVMEVTSSGKGAWRDMPLLILDTSRAINPRVHEAIKNSGLNVVLVDSVTAAEHELRNRGVSEREILEKLTGFTHSMRRDAELTGWAEEVCAMPAIKVANPGKSSKRPALPKNRKRDRWN